MSTIKDQIDIFNKVLTDGDNDIIMNTIKSFHPFLILYLINNNNIKKYTKKLPERFFNIEFDDECVKYIINIYKFNHDPDSYDTINYHHDDDISFIIRYISNVYIINNDINNINNLYYHFKNCAFEILYQMILCNSVELLDTFMIMNFYNNDSDGLEDDSIFDEAFCKYIMRETNCVEMISIFHNYSKAYPDKMSVDINTVFNCALVYGDEKCMHYALNHGADYSLDNNPFDIAEPVDTLMYAIIGNNINCIKTVCELYLNKYINENIWEQYILFAAAFGTIEIIQYLISLKPHKFEQIEQVYNKILKYGLINANFNCVKYALNNGAIYNDEMGIFVHYYNTLYSRSTDNVNHLDSYDYYIILRTLPNNYDTEYQKCLDYIKYRII
jgi:hypothetical protein